MKKTDAYIAGLTITFVAVVLIEVFVFKFTYSLAITSALFSGLGGIAAVVVLNKIKQRRVANNADRS